jgi:hypothetical protein
MTLAEFVAAVQAGQVMAGAGGLAAGGLVDGIAPLSADDPDAIAAEAFNQGIVDAEASWARVRADVVALLAVRESV